MSWFSALLGLDSLHNASVAGANSADQLKQQKQFAGDASNIYSQVNQQGQAQSNAYSQNYLPLLQQFGSIAGLGPQGGVGQTGTAGGIVNPNPTEAQSFTAQNDALAGRTNPANNPYQLDQNQQALLNQSTANLARQHQGAVASFEQQMQANGISDPRALQVGREQLGEHFAALKATTETQFYEQVKQDKLKALQELISGLSDYGKTGISEQETAASGYGSLAGGAANVAAQQSGVQAQQANAFNEQFGGLLKLGGFAAGGGFSGAPTAAPAAAMSPGINPVPWQGPLNNPFGGYTAPIG